MCVIIYIPKESTISIKEIKNAWNTNPHGAGYCIQKDNKVHFKRGFMDIDSFISEIEPLIGRYNLLLHFRISTSKSINKVQTHPYKKGDVTLTEGITDKPVICMNGVISGQKEYLNCNDTMSYIIDNREAFEIVNQNVLNIIEENTGAKWAVMKPDEVLLSSKFQFQDGRYYSNKNHLWTTYYRNYNIVSKRTTKGLNDMIKNKNLRKSIRKNRELHEDLLDFIDIWCNGQELCDLCTKCLKSAQTLRDVKITLDENYYWSEKAYENTCEINNDYTENALDYWYDNIYDYKNIDNSYLFDE